MRNAPPSQAAAGCPACGQAGRPVKPVTLRSLVSAEALAGLDLGGSFRFCAERSCEVAYFDVERGLSVPRTAVVVPIGQKGDGPPRPVCYCFEHSAEEIEADVLANGTSTLSQAIVENCRQGRDRCAETNPQGSCCLANVRRVVEQALAARGDAAPVAGAGDDCCTAATATSPVAPAAAPSRAGLWASGGAVVAAMLSSACCWLPLLLVLFGASAAGIAGFFEAWRPVLLGVTAVFLAAGFWFAYGRQSRCATDGSCAVAAPRLLRLQRGMLWVATVVVLALATFPDTVGWLLASDAGGGNGVLSAAAGAQDWQLRIDGMTCEGCAAGLVRRLSDLSGVARASVDFAAGRAALTLSDPAARNDVLQAIEDAGFAASPLSAEASPGD